MTQDEFVALLRDEVGLSVTAEQIGADFDELPGWDSALLLHLLTVLERESGNQIPLPEVLRCRTLAAVLELTAA